MDTVAVKFKGCGKFYLFTIPAEVQIPVGSEVYVESDNGPLLATTVTPVMHTDTEEEFKKLCLLYGANPWGMKQALSQRVELRIPFDKSVLTYWKVAFKTYAELFEKQSEQADDLNVEEETGEAQDGA